MRKSAPLAFILVVLLAGCSTASDTSTDQSSAAETERLEANKALARRWFDEVINKRNVDAISDIYASDYAYHGPGGMEMSGTGPLREFAAAILAASEDRQAVIHQQVAEGNLVVTRFTSTGTRTGPWMGEEPDSSIWITEGIDISRIENGRIVEDWEVIRDSSPE